MGVFCRCHLFQDEDRLKRKGKKLNCWCLKWTVVWAAIVNWEFNTLSDNQTRGQVEKEKHFSLPWGKLLWLLCVICQSLTLFVNRHVRNFMIFVFICIYLPVKYLLHFYKSRMKNVQYNIILFISLLWGFFYVPGNKLNYLKNKVLKNEWSVLPLLNKVMVWNWFWCLGYKMSRTTCVCMTV